MGNQVFMQGNEAMAESAIRAGCKLFFGYPITPSSEVPEYYARAMRERPEEGITFIQAETEVAAFNMVAGAAATGHRAMTATSGPGFSLGQEAMSYMSAADLPAVIVEIMRAGPADGEILAAQGDYFQATKGGGHGDYCNLVLAPYSVQELCELMQESFELAEKYRNPVILLSDATLAKMRESVELPGRPELPVPSELPNALRGCGKDKEPHKVITCGDGAVQWGAFNDRHPGGRGALGVLQSGGRRHHPGGLRFHGPGLRQRHEPGPCRGHQGGHDPSHLPLALPPEGFRRHHREEVPGLRAQRRSDGGRREAFRGEQAGRQLLRQAGRHHAFSQGGPGRDPQDGGALR